MKYNFKAHPLMLAEMLKPFLFVLVIPVIRGVVQYILRQEISNIFGMEMAALAAVAVFSFFRCRAFSLSADSRRLIIKKGLIFKSVSNIPLEKLSSVSMKVSVIDAVFGAVNCHINTEAGRRGKPDFDFKLRKRDAERLSELIYGGDIRTEIRFSPVKIAIMAATTSSAVTGLIIGVPVLNQAGKLLGVALSDMIFNEINAASTRLNTYFPPVVNVITIIFIIAYGFSVAVSFLKHINFRLLISRSKFEIKSGFFVRKKTLFSKKCVNDVYIKQTPLMRLFGLFSLKATVGGYGDTRSEKAVIVPCGRRGEVTEQFEQYFSYLDSSGDKIRASRGKRSLWRFMWLPRIIVILVLGVCGALIILFPFFDRFVVFLALVALAFTAYYTNLCFYNYRHGGIIFGKSISAYGSTGFSSCELYCEREKIGVLKLIRTPADRRYGTCKLKITVRSENADSIRVRNIDHSLALESIEEYFGVDGINRG